MDKYDVHTARRQQGRWGWVAGLAMLLLILPGFFQPLTAPIAALPPSSLHGAMVLQATPPPLTKQFEETSYYLKDIDFVSADTGWAVGEPHWDQASKAYTGTIIKTTDGGATWAPQPADVTETLRNVDFLDTNTGWAVGTNGTILYTADGGADWTRQVVASTDEFRGVAFVNATQGWATSFHATHYDYQGEADDWRGSIWHTNDGGLTWQAQTLPDNASLLNRIKFIDAQHGWAVGVEYTGNDQYGRPQHAGIVYRTINGGQTWEEFYSPGADITLTGVEWVDANHGWVVGFPNRSDLTGGFVFHTADGGQTWQRQTPGGIYDPLWDVQFIDVNRGYAVGFNYIAAWGPPVFRTLDGGATWQKIRMAQHDNEGLFGVAIVDSQVIAMGDHDFIAKSTRAWDAYAPPCYDGDCLFTQSYLNTHYTFHDVFFADEANGWAVGSRSYSPEVWGQVIFHTADGGLTWASQYEQAPPAGTSFSYFRLDSISFADSQNGWAVGSSETSWVTDHWEHHGAILRTTDGGAHWQEQGQELYASWDLEFFDVQSLNSQNGWALAAMNFPSQDIFLAHTTDGGSHWNWVDTGITGTIQVGSETVLGSVVFTDALHGLALGGSSQVISTSDGGAHWARPALSCGAYPCYYNVFAAAFADNQNGWLVGEGVFHTTDGGANWVHQDIGIGGEIQDIQFVDRKIGWLATDRGELWYTGNGGTRWHRLDGNTGYALRGLHFVNAQRGWFVGDGGTILRYVADHLPIVGEAFLPLLKK
jgi:photosystem II stability/assembly factor-like uncharacterized protein